MKEVVGMVRMRGVTVPVLASLVVLLTAVAGAQSPNLDTDKTLYIVSTAHLDTQWRWTIQDTINRFVPNTFRTNFAHFEASPNYTFSFEGAFRYGLIKEYYPEDYEKLRQYVAQGRWRVCGSSVDAGDANVPSPEALMRHILLGNGYFRREFGKTSCDIFLPDCFGFGYALPSVAAHCGLKGFSTQKLSWGSADGIPFGIGVWEGPDGRSIVAALKPGGYGSGLDRDMSQDQGWLKSIDALGAQAGVFAGYKYIGVGDQGGSVSPETVQWLDKSIAGTGPIKVRSAGADQLYRDLTETQKARLPHYRGELLLTTHGTGCYTSQSAMKRWNRRNELLADGAERAAVAAQWLGGLPYPKAKLDEAWTRFLWHQFHDDLTGTSIPQAYVFSWNDELIAQKQFADVVESSVGAVSRGLDTSGGGTPVVVYNPLGVSRQDVVEVGMQFRGGPPTAVEVRDPEGRAAIGQVGETVDGVTQVLIRAQVPPVSFSVYRVSPAPAAPAANGPTATESTLESDRYRVRLDENGDIASVLDKAANRELLAAPARLELLADNSGRWPAWEVLYNDVTAEPTGYAEKPVSVRVVESGPVRATLELTRPVADSTVVQRVSLVQGFDGLIVDTRVGWKTRGMMLKAAFPLTASNPNATYDLGLGTVERGNNRPSKYEVPAQQWADLTTPDGSFGAAVLNDCKYGWDKPADNVLRLTLVRTPTAIGGYRDQASADLGRHQFTYALAGHSGDWRDGKVPQLAARLNQPLLAFVAPAHQGALGRQLSLLKVTPEEQVAVRCVKQAQESGEVVVRLQELWGRPVEGVRVECAAPILAARELNGAEEPLGALKTENGALVVNLGAYEPRTLALKLAPAAVTLEEPTSVPLNLPFDVDAVSPDGDKADGDLDGAGHTIPAELFPRELTCEGVRFRLGPTEAKEANAVACRGQSLSLPEGNFNRLYLLACSTGEDVSATFRVGGKYSTQTVDGFTGNIGQWDSRLPAGKMVSRYDQLAPMFVKREPVAWVGTHRHRADGGTDAYVFCYLFKVALDLPAGVDAVTLPDDPRVLVFAATASSDPGAACVAGQDLYDRPFTVEDLSRPARADQLPLLPAVSPGKVAPGLRYAYFEGTYDVCDDFRNAKPAAEGVVAAPDLSMAARNEDFGVKLTGYIEVPRDGVYAFVTRSDDGSRLYIGDRLVVDNDGRHSAEDASGEIGLAAGRHPLTILYFQGPVSRVLEVNWAGPDVPYQPVPASVLSHEE
jgi:alpha-mannosidase